MNDWDGVDRRQFHKWRWRLLLVWVTLFTLVTFLILWHIANDEPCSCNAIVTYIGGL